MIQRDQLIMAARQIGMTEDTFKDAIADIYAAMVDMELEKNPDKDLVEQISEFSDHKIVIQSRRESLE